jgi:hypothetical protein
VRGTIIDASTGRATKAEVYWGQQSSKYFLEYFNSYNGQFQATLTEYEPYKFLPRKPGHFSQQILVDPRIIEKQGKDTVDVILYITPEEIEPMITSEPAIRESNYP